MEAILEFESCSITVEYDYDHDLTPNPWASLEGLPLIGGLLGVDWIATHVQFGDAAATGRCAQIIGDRWFSGEIEAELIGRFDPWEEYFG